MANPGPKPTPTAILKARGSWRAKTREGEPEFEVGAPEPPAWLAGKAVTWFRQTSEILAERGVMTQADRVALAMWAQALSDYLDARDAAEPREARHYWDMVMRGCRDFGMTPASRTGIKVDKEPREKKSISKFFKAV